MFSTVLCIYEPSRNVLRHSKRFCSVVYLKIFGGCRYGRLASRSGVLSPESALYQEIGGIGEIGKGKQEKGENIKAEELGREMNFGFLPNSHRMILSQS